MDQYLLLSIIPHLFYLRLLRVVPGLPGCHTQRNRLDEVLKNAKKAVELYLETLSGRSGGSLSRRAVGLQRLKAVT